MTSGSPYRLPRSVTPSHYAIELRLDPTAPTFDGTEDVTVEVHEPVTEIVVNGKDLTVRVRRDLRRRRVDGRDREGGARPLGGPDHARAAGRARDRRVHPAPGVHRQAQRPDGGDVPLALHRRRRAGARHHHHALRGDRRAPQLPVLGRARPQGVVPDDPGRPRGPDRADEHARDRARAGRPRVRAGAVRPVDRDVDLPRVCRGRASGPHRAVVRGADADPGRLPSRPAAPGRVRERGRCLRPGLVRRLLRRSRTRSRSSTRPRSRTSRRARWRTPGSSPTARRCCCSIPRRPPTSSSSTSPRRSRTSSRTCGSATSSRCAGGTASG